MEVAGLLHPPPLALSKRRDFAHRHGEQSGDLHGVLVHGFRPAGPDPDPNGMPVDFNFLEVTRGNPLIDVALANNESARLLDQHHTELIGKERITDRKGVG